MPGRCSEPELRLASTPPLDASDILSLIVFNTSTNQLTAIQQQELAVRAGTLAAGFLASPLVTALGAKLGLEILEIEPAAIRRRRAAGDDRRRDCARPRRPLQPSVRPRRVRRGDHRYHLSRLLRIRATFSDAATLSARSPFRRVERAGIDLLMFFSF